MAEWKEKTLECIVKDADGYSTLVDATFKYRFGDEMEVKLVSAKDRNGKKVDVSEGEKDRLEQECLWWSYKFEFGSRRNEMNRNVKIAKELVKLAKSLVAGQDPYSGLAERICYGIADVLVALGDFGAGSEPVAFYNGLSDYFHGLESEFGKDDAVYDSSRLREIKEEVREKAKEMSKYSPIGNTAMWRKYGGLRDAYEPYSHHYLKLKKHVLDLMNSLPGGW